MGRHLFCFPFLYFYGTIIHINVNISANADYRCVNSGLYYLYFDKQNISTMSEKVNVYLVAAPFFCGYGII